MGFGFLWKLNYFKVLFGLLVLSELGSTQPFLNSLAVLFRARPPWPTTFPVGSSPVGTNGPGTNLNTNSGLLASGSAQQGILVAHPIPNHKAPVPSFQKFIPPQQLPKFPIHLQSPGQFFPSTGGAQAQKLQPQPVPVLQNLQIQNAHQNQEPKPVLQKLRQTLLQNSQHDQPLNSQVQSQNSHHIQVQTLNSQIQPQNSHHTQGQQQNSQIQSQNSHHTQGQQQNSQLQPQNSHHTQGQQQNSQNQPQNSHQVQVQQQNSQFQPENSHHVQIQSQNLHYIQAQNSEHIIPANAHETAQLSSSAVSTGSFSFPDPPSPPQFHSMSGNSEESAPNYAMESSNIKSHWQPSSNANSLENHSSGSKPQWRPSSKATNLENHSSGSDYKQSSQETLLKPVLSSHEKRLNSVHSNHYSKAAGAKTEQKAKSLAFRPSPQLIEPSSSRFNSKETWDSDGQPKKVSSPFQAADAKNPPRYESGFQPISYHQYASGYGTTATREQYTNSHTQYYNPWSSSQNIQTQLSTPPTSTTTLRPYRKDRKIVNGAVSRSVITTDASIEESKSSESSEVSGGTTTSSSELVEDWIRPNKKQTNVPQRFPVYKKKTTVHDGRPLKIRPVKCERYHRYGFCPVTSHYPTAQVEKIASRCSALLAHLIAPLPKTDVHYDIVVTRNESRRAEGASRRGGSRGWFWKNFKGKPLCNTEEIKIMPGYAKDEDGQWLIILQTQIWKQEAQVSICSLAHGAQSPCRGLLCNRDMRLSLKTKCVQRFTAQRLAVLDPENQDRCPIVKSVFLPSACVCLSDEGSSAEATSGSQEGSSSNQVQVVVPPAEGPPPPLNGTFMIVTKKFTTNESSTESQVDLPL